MKIKNLLNRFLKRDKKGIKTEKDIQDVLTLGEKAGIISADETELIRSVFELGDTPVFDVMTPRVDIFAVKYDQPIGDLVETIIKSGHSKVPVYVKNMDDILGIIYATDILKLWGSGGKYFACDLARQPFYIPGYKTVLSTLREFQSNNISIALIVDEYGGISGLVTLEDLIEEIVGELKDEFDQEELLFRKLKDGSFLVDAKIELEDFNKLFKTNFEEEEYHTLGGLIYHHIDRIPQNDETIEIPPIKLKIIKMQEQRIKFVKVYRDGN